MLYGSGLVTATSASRGTNHAHVTGDQRTVKTHLGHVFEELGATSRTEAVKIATRRGPVRLN
jgi:hypothetical protein